MHDKIMAIIKTIAKKTLKVLAIIVLSCIGAVSITVAFLYWPNHYERRTYDLGNKYMNCEWMELSDSVRIVITSKDGNHRASLKMHLAMDEEIRIIFHKDSLDHMYFEGYNRVSDPQRFSIIELNNIILRHGSGPTVVFDEEKQHHRYEYGIFNHMYSSTKLPIDSFKEDYIRVDIDRMVNGRYPASQIVFWIWPLKNPLLKKYPFGEKARKSKITD